MHLNLQEGNTENMFVPAINTHSYKLLHSRRPQLLSESSHQRVTRLSELDAQAIRKNKATIEEVRLLFLSSTSYVIYSYILLHTLAD
jgi:hypothetical protein